MFTQKITIQVNKKNASDIKEELQNLFETLRHNGQVIGNENIIFLSQNMFYMYITCPERDSLNNKNNSKWVNKFWDKLKKLGTPKIELCGKVIIKKSSVCKCRKPNFYILFTTYVSLESPLKCGNCFLQIPLYHLPADYEEDHGDILNWQSNYKSCDTLQMNCAVGEKFGTMQISNPFSSLSKQGLSICDRIEKKIKIPTYYYLYNYERFKPANDQKKLCPKCGNKWLLRNKLHDIFDFKCNKCKLISNITLMSL